MGLSGADTFLVSENFRHQDFTTPTTIKSKHGG